MSKLNQLFRPIAIGPIELKNRIVMLGMGIGLGEMFRPNDQLTCYLKERAAGGVGLIIVSSLRPTNFNGVTPASLGIWEDSFIPLWQKVVNSIHTEGAKIAAQISLIHEWRADENQPLEVVGPSDGLGIMRGVTTRALTTGEIKQIVEEFGKATKRAREANFDAVEFHFGNGFLIHQFMSPRTNKRTDEYGGSLENRLRLPIDIIRNAKMQAGTDFPLLCRFSGDELMEGGLTLEDTKVMAPILQGAGIAAINVQPGIEVSNTPLVQRWVPQGAFVYMAKELKKVLNIPVITGYRIKDPSLAEDIIAKGEADMVGLGRALLADPEWPNKVRDGRIRDIRPCITCCRCLDDVLTNKKVSCSVNYRVGKEYEYPVFQLGPQHKRLLVVGGGPAGMEFARVAASRGHDVSIYEKGPKLGGSLVVSSVVNPEFEQLLYYMRRQTEKLAIKVFQNQRVTPELVNRINPDAIILATGGIPPQITGLLDAHVISSHDILNLISESTIPKDTLGRVLLWKSIAFLFKRLYNPSLIRFLLRLNFPFGPRVIIVGSGIAGCELADLLAEKGKRATIIGESMKIGEGIGPVTRWVIRKRLKHNGVRMIELAHIDEISVNSVTVTHGDSSEILSANTVVLAPILIPNPSLKIELEGRGPALYCIGDAAEPALVREAFASAFLLGINM